MRFESPRQLHASKVRYTYRRRRARAQQAIKHRTQIQMPSHTHPPTRQTRRRIPAYAELQRQAIPNHDFCVLGQVAHAVGCCAVDDAGSGGLGRGVQEDIEVVGDVQVGELEDSRQGDDERDVVYVCGAHGADLVVGVVEGGKVGYGEGGDAAG